MHMSRINKKDDSCLSCIKFVSNNHPDFKQIEPDGSSIKIEQIRNMQEDIIKKPIVSNRKVYIIENADKMTIGAQNCLLKTLEEPPLYITIILLIENETMILNTIKSRCTKILFTEETLEELTPENREIYEELEKIFQDTRKYTILDVLNKLDVLYKNEKNIFEILEFINDILFKNIKNDINNIKYIDYVEETKQRLKSNANFNMSIDYLIYNIWKN